MKIRFKKLRKDAVIPLRAHTTDAGFDLVATSCNKDNNGNIVYGIGIAVEIPEGYVGLVFPRSSIANKHLQLTNAVGVIDAGYRGEIKAKFKPVCAYNDYNSFVRPRGFHTYEVGERIAQLIIMPIPNIEFEEAEELSDSGRGIGGYGSTGK